MQRCSGQVTRDCPDEWSVVTATSTDQPTDHPTGGRKPGAPALSPVVPDSACTYRIAGVAPPRESLYKSNQASNAHLSAFHPAASRPDHTASFPMPFDTPRRQSGFRSTTQDYFRSYGAGSRSPPLLRQSGEPCSFEPTPRTPHWMLERRTSPENMSVTRSWQSTAHRGE